MLTSPRLSFLKTTFIPATWKVNWHRHCIYIIHKNIIHLLSIQTLFCTVGQLIPFYLNLGEVSLSNNVPGLNIKVQYRHLILTPVNWTSASAKLYKHPWTTCQIQATFSCEVIHAFMPRKLDYAQAAHTFSADIKCRHSDTNYSAVVPVPVLMAVWSKALQLTASSLSLLPRFESQLGYVRKALQFPPPLKSG